MNSIGKTLCEVVAGFASLANSDRVELEQATLLFLFRGIRLSELKSRFQEQGIAFGAHTHTLFWCDGYLMCNVKLWLYSCAGMSFRRAVSKAKEYDIKPEDYELASHLTRKELASLFISYTKIGYPSFSLPRWKSIVESLMIKQNQFVSRHAYFKGRFLQSWSIGRKDLIDDMNEWALKMTYCEYPRFETPLHLGNKYRQFCRQRLLKIIGKNTTQARQRMTSTFDMLVVDIDNIPASWLDSDQLRVGLSGGDQDEELCLSVRMLLQRAKPKQARFLSLLMGSTTPDFDSFLTINRYAKDSDRLSDANMPLYIEACCHYVGVSTEAGRSYLNTVGEALLPQLSKDEHAF